MNDGTTRPRTTPSRRPAVVDQARRQPGRRGSVGRDARGRRRAMPRDLGAVARDEPAIRAPPEPARPPEPQLQTPPRRPSADAPGARAPRPGRRRLEPLAYDGRRRRGHVRGLVRGEPRRRSVDAAIASGARAPAARAPSPRARSSRRARARAHLARGLENTMTRTPPRPRASAPASGLRRHGRRARGFLCAAAMACADFEGCAPRHRDVLKQKRGKRTRVRRSLRTGAVDQRYLPRRAAPGVARTASPAATFIALETREKHRRRERNRARAGRLHRSARDPPGSRARAAFAQVRVDDAGAAGSAPTRFGSRRAVPFPEGGRAVSSGSSGGGRSAIADQMGVGKTIQALAIAAALPRRGPDPRRRPPCEHAPAWAREAERVAPRAPTRKSRRPRIRRRRLRAWRVARPCGSAAS